MRRVWLVVLLVLAACGTGDDDAAITVLAASSLTEAMTEIGAAFEEAEGVEVTLSFGGSSSLAEQANQGAPADVIVTADRASLAKVDDAGEPTDVARNRLAIIVEPGNPKRITGLADLARDDVVLVLCAPEVPCGRFGALALEKAGVVVTPASLEEKVKGVVSKVTLGEADAGLVYVTDVEAAGDDAAGVDIDVAADRELEAVYSMAVLGQSEHAALAAEFIGFVAGAEGRRVLAAHGFLAP
ncbi:MAG TPA: molybdate ABC transporter substrate-binding protein [Acidimicrobiales bacterium]|nr:molybdate ABC transporter substrate-binding protein [Acidimicrobiales bacterium]